MINVIIGIDFYHNKTREVRLLFGKKIDILFRNFYLCENKTKWLVINFTTMQDVH